MPAGDQTDAPKNQRRRGCNACQRIKSLEKKPAVNGMPAMRQSRDHVGPIGLRHMRFEPAHFAHILFAAEGVNHAARAQKQTRLEKTHG